VSTKGGRTQGRQAQQYALLKEGGLYRIDLTKGLVVAGAKLLRHNGKQEEVACQTDVMPLIYNIPITFPRGVFSDAHAPGTLISPIGGHRPRLPRTHGSMVQLSWPLVPLPSLVPYDNNNNVTYNSSPSTLSSTPLSSDEAFDILSSSSPHNQSAFLPPPSLDPQYSAPSSFASDPPSQSYSSDVSSQQPSSDTVRDAQPQEATSWLNMLLMASEMLDTSRPQEQPSAGGGTAKRKRKISSVSKTVKQEEQENEMTDV